jgi:cytochrome c oxidase assembly protein Cox11
MTTPNQTTRPAPRRDLFVAFLCGGLVAGMVGLSFAAVPF